MRRREFILVLGTAMALPSASLAQQEKKVFRIGYLSAPTRESVQRPLEVFLRKLRELGWVEGENFIIEYRWAEGNIIRLPELASELVALNVDLIVAPATSAAVAAKNATSRIPIVMIFPGDPVELGLVSSLSQPGGNVTGTTAAAGPGIIGKLLEILKQAVPQITAVAILGNSADPGLASQMKELRFAAEFAEPSPSALRSARSGRVRSCICRNDAGTHGRPCNYGNYFRAASRPTRRTCNDSAIAGHNVHQGVH